MLFTLSWVLTEKLYLFVELSCRLAPNLSQVTATLIAPQPIVFFLSNLSLTRALLVGQPPAQIDDFSLWHPWLRVLNEL